MDTVTDFLGIKIKKENNKITLTQPQLIQSIINDLLLVQNKNFNTLPALTSQLLHPEPGQDPHDKHDLQYKSIIGKINYVKKTARSDIAYATHQVAQFSQEP